MKNVKKYCKKQYAKITRELHKFGVADIAKAEARVKEIDEKLVNACGKNIDEITFTLSRANGVEWLYLEKHTIEHLSRIAIDYLIALVMLRREEKND